MSATVFTFSPPIPGVYFVSQLQCLQYATDTDPLSYTEYVIGGKFHKEGPCKMFIFTILILREVLCQFSYFQSCF